MKILKYKNRPKYQVKDEDVNLLVGHLARIGGKTTVKHIKSALQVLAWNPCDVTNPPSIDWGEVVNVAVEKGVIKRGIIKYGYQNRTMVWLPHVDPAPQKTVRKALVGFLVSVLSMALLATPSVVNVEAKQRYPWNGLVDITVTLSGTEEECTAATFLMYATNKTTRAELSLRSLEAVGEASGAANTWTRRFVWDATADVGYAKLGEVELTVAPAVGVQLWEDGPYWAECNVGASQPEVCGYYFWWGDTVGYKRNADNDGWISVKDGTGFSFSDGNCPTYGKDNSQLQSAGYIDASGNLTAKYDAATAHRGAPWRMPTDAEFVALINNCTTTWTSRNGLAGLLVTGKGDYASKSIFLPAAGDGSGSYFYDLNKLGYYWSSTPSSSVNYALGLEFYRNVYFRHGDASKRNCGLPIRPVRGFVQ